MHSAATRGQNFTAVLSTATKLNRFPRTISSCENLDSRDINRPHHNRQYEHQKRETPRENRKDIDVRALRRFHERSCELTAYRRQQHQQREAEELQKAFSINLQCLR